MGCYNRQLTDTAGYGPSSNYSEFRMKDKMNDRMNDRRKELDWTLHYYGGMGNGKGDILESMLPIGTFPKEAILL